MENDFKKLAKEQGFSDQEIEEFLSTQPAPTPDISTNEVQNKPNVVSPLPNSPVEMTQDFNAYNPYMGYYNDTHKGVDVAASEGQPATNPVGGTVMSVNDDPAYGNTMVIAGESPEERSQRTGNPATGDFSGYTTAEDAVRASHFSSPIPYNVGDYVATGEAKLNAGSTGNVRGPHLDLESFNLGDMGNYEQYRSFLEKYPEFRKILATYR